MVSFPSSFGFPWCRARPAPTTTRRRPLGNLEKRKEKEAVADLAKVVNGSKEVRVSVGEPFGPTCISVSQICSLG